MGIYLARTRDELKNRIESLKATLEDAGVRGSVGFVPTMGALHEGHTTLVRRSVRDNAITVVSIFVNPKQFSANEDLDKYPRTLDADLKLCEKAGAQVVYAPSVDEMYPTGFATQVSVHGMDQVLCGAYRPGHFSGVCTVVLLLLNLVRADHAYFGLKDFQQYSILSRMLLDLEHATQMVGVATVRDADGLAMSSRNRYLDAHARNVALRIPTALRAASEAYILGEENSAALLLECKKHLTADASFELQYCELRDAQTLGNVAERLQADAVLAVAAHVLGADGTRTRLIDNVLLTRNPDHLSDLLDFTHRSSRPS